MIGLIKGAFGLATQFLENRKEKGKAKAELQATTAKAEGIYRENRAAAGERWATAAASAMDKSSKDEAWTYTFIAILVAHFIPWEPVQSALSQGWENLDKAPDWFIWAFLASIAASFGIHIPDWIARARGK